LFSAAESKDGVGASDNGGSEAAGNSPAGGRSVLTGAFGTGSGIPGKGGSGAGGRAGFTGSAPDFFLFFLNPMPSPKQEGGLNSIEPYRKNLIIIGIMLLIYLATLAQPFKIRNVAVASGTLIISPNLGSHSLSKNRNLQSS